MCDNIFIGFGASEHVQYAHVNINLISGGTQTNTDVRCSLLWYFYSVNQPLDRRSLFPMPKGTHLTEGKDKPNMLNILQIEQTL